jgi:hypothetical protein
VEFGRARPSGGAKSAAETERSRIRDRREAEVDPCRTDASSTVTHRSVERFSSKIDLCRMTCQEILGVPGDFGMLRSKHIEIFQVYRRVKRANFSERQRLSAFAEPKL